MFERISQLTKTATFRQSLVTTSSTIINGFLGAFFYFFLAKFLGSHDFGVFTVAVTTIALMSGIVDFGSDQGIIRFVPKYKDNPEHRNKFIKLALAIKISSGLLTFAILLLFARDISSNLFKQPELIGVIPLIGAGVLTQILFSFSTSFSQACERFFLWGGLFVGTNLIRLIGIFFLFGVGSLSGISSILLYITLPFLGFVASFAFINRDFLSAKAIFTEFKELFTFNKWVFAFVLVSAIGSRLDIYFTTRFVSLAAVGVYGLAVQIASLPSQLTGAIGAVTSPKFASFTNHQLNRAYTLKALAFTTALAVALAIILIPLSVVVISLVGQDFQGAFVPFLILLAGMLIFLAGSPIRDSIIYYFSKPQFFFWMGLGHTAVVTLASFWLIPRFSIVGSSIVVLIGQIFILVSSTAYWFFQKENV